MAETWKITLRVYRQKENQEAHFDDFHMEVNPDEYVLDAVERAWAFHDRSICFRHACHHSTCGACGMRVNGVEKLTCITLIREVTHDGATLKVEPLRNFPVVSDLDRTYFGADSRDQDHIGYIDAHTRAIFGRSYAAEPEVLVRELVADEAVAAADTLLLTVPNTLGVDYNAHVIDSVLKYIAPELGWR